VVHRVPTENETDARETWSYLRKHWDQIHLSLYTGTFGLGHDVPVFQHPEDYDIQIKFSAEGDPTYTRNDGGDWDLQPMHKAFHARSDIPVPCRAQRCSTLRTGPSCCSSCAG